MSIRITPLTQAFPTGGFETNERMRTMLAHAGVEFFRASCFLHKHMSEMPLFNVHLPLMHQCIELLAKALVARMDANTTPKKHRHGTLKMMERYKGKVPVFAAILHNPEKKDLIIQLEKAYYMVRYGEASLYYERNDIELSMDIAVELIDAYHGLTGVPLLSKHFPIKNSS